MVRSSAPEPGSRRFGVPGRSIIFAIEPAQFDGKAVFSPSALAQPKLADDPIGGQIRVRIVLTGGEQGGVEPPLHASERKLAHAMAEGELTPAFDFTGFIKVDEVAFQRRPQIID